MELASSSPEVVEPTPGSDFSPTAYERAAIHVAACFIFASHGEVQGNVPSIQARIWVAEQYVSRRSANLRPILNSRQLASTARSLGPATVNPWWAGGQSETPVGIATQKAC